MALHSLTMGSCGLHSPTKQVSGRVHRSGHPVQSGLLVLIAALLGSSGCEVIRKCDELEINGGFPCDQPMVQGQPLWWFRRSETAQRPTVGSAVDVRNVVVSAIDDYLEPSGSTGAVWVQQYVPAGQLAMNPFGGCAPVPESMGGGRVCGIQLFNVTNVPPGSHLFLGDIVNVQGGSYDEFRCEPCSTQFPTGKSLPEFSDVNVGRVGSGAAPQPVPVTLADLTGPNANDYLGVLVTISDASIQVRANSRGDMTVNGIVIDDTLTTLVDSMNRPIDDGVRLRKLTGVVNYFFNPQLLPRSAADIEVMP